MRIANPTGSRLVPALRYRNVAAAVDWLCGAFGFEKHDVVTAVDGTILHARLMFGSDMILLLPARGPDAGGRAAEDAGNEMQSCYFVVDDADLHYRQAKAAGAEILDITEYDYGGRGYCCRDPEGHLWNFGTYDPRRGQALTTIDHWPTPPSQPPYWQTVANDLRMRTAAGFKSLGDKITPPVIVAAVVAAVIAAATVGWMVALPQSGDKRLTFRSSPAAQQEAAQPRTQVNSLAIRSPAAQQQSDEFERAARQAAPAPTRVNSPAFAAVGVQPEQDSAGRETAERNAEDALRQLRAAQRTAGEAFRQLREATAESAAAAPVDTRRQVAKAAPDPREQEALLQQQQLAREQQIARQQQMLREQQMAKEQQLARERAAKESAALIEEQFARERAQKDAKLSAVAPPKEPSRPPQEAKADGQPFWDCQPSPSGEVVCNPKKGMAAPAAAAPTAPAPIAAAPAVAPAPETRAPVPPKPWATAAAAEPAAAPAPQQPKASPRLWDCQPQPPTGEVVCKPMAGAAKQ
jgi:uncharacterized glyoxalase superfamily protein PhnB